MNKLSIVFLTVLTMFFASCDEKPSKAFQKIQDDVKTIEAQIGEITDCDELQMGNFGIMGLRSDLEDYTQNGALTENEAEQLNGMIDELEATWNGKWAALDCEENLADDEFDTSGEEDDGYYD